MVCSRSYRSFAKVREAEARMTNAECRAGCRSLRVHTYHTILVIIIIYSVIIFIINQIDCIRANTASRRKVYERRGTMTMTMTANIGDARVRHAYSKLFTSTSKMWQRGKERVGLVRVSSAIVLVPTLLYSLECNQQPLRLLQAHIHPFNCSHISCPFLILDLPAARKVEHLTYHIPPIPPSLTLISS